MQSSNNPKLYVNGVTSQWVPTCNAYPVHATSVDSAKTWMYKPFYIDIIQPPPSIIATFDSYLNTLEQWDYLLLKDIVPETSAHEMAHICLTDVKINIASDGSSVEEENKMTFGWIIVNADKEILAEHAEPVFGQATSFRAKGYGLLS
eukprot:7338471-Ditylum_brightwellii.AAC.1